MVHNFIVNVVLTSEKNVDPICFSIFVNVDPT